MASSKKVKNLKESVFDWSPLPQKRLLNFVADNNPKTKSNSINDSNSNFNNLNPKSNPNLYPNCDVNVWLRSCEKEIEEPLLGTTKGKVPKWLQGTLIRNGPGSLKVGQDNFQHLFDSSALLHRFNIEKGKVTYQSKFIQTEAFKRNRKAQRIVFTEFGTKATPDPCHTIFDKVSAVFNAHKNASDNAMISVYPFCDELYAFSESPVIYRLNEKNLDTEGKVDVSEHVAIVNHTSHPHVINDGNVFNIGMSISGLGPKHNVICFPARELKNSKKCTSGELPSEKLTSKELTPEEFTSRKFKSSELPPEELTSKKFRSKKIQSKESGNSMFQRAKIVASLPARWPLNPSYMHTFGITENYFIIVEQPLSLSLPSVVTSTMNSDPLAGCFRWYYDEPTQINIINRSSGKLEKTFFSEAFFYLHIINQYESKDRIILDICCYRDPAMLDCMYVETMRNIQSNPDYAKMFRGRPLRFILPLNVDLGNCERFIRFGGSNAKAYVRGNGDVFVYPEKICDLGCETPRVNYEKCLGKFYRYFYAISSDVDAHNPGTIIKVDTQKKTCLTWCEENCYPSEPIFVPSPRSKSEDDGIILSAMVWGKKETNKVGLLILDAKSFKEIARATFKTPSEVPKCLHGWYLKNRHC